MRIGIFDLLASRGLELDEACRRRIEQEHDVSALMRLLRRAATVTSVDEIFEE